MSENRLIYKGEDITMDVTFKIESIVRLIAEHHHLAFDEAYTKFVSTRTYKALQNPATLMWAESAEYISERYDEEVAPQEQATN
jgi:hypothetical protein